MGIFGQLGQKLFCDDEVAEDWMVRWHTLCLVSAHTREYLSAEISY